MRYLKTYENKTEPKIGDYVICTCDSGDNDIDNFTKNHIGKIVNINRRNKREEIRRRLLYTVHYNEKIRLFGNIMFPDNDPEFFRDEIVHFGTYPDMETILTARKYNL